MKYLDLKAEVERCNKANIRQLKNSIEAYEGRLYNLPKKKKISRLHDLNKRRSVTSSNEIEGIKVNTKRESELFLDNAKPETKEDYLLFGYNEALEYIYQNYKYISLNEKLIKELHYIMYKNISPAFGGKYKDSQNYIREYDHKGKLLQTVFIPPDPEETVSLMGNLIYQFEECLKDPLIDRLTLVFVFINDYLCIHPFNDGNGRTSRLLTTLLLLKSGYNMDLYYSLSYLILDHIDGYYQSLKESGKEWSENKTDPSPFVEYMFSLMVEGYRKLAYMQDLDDLKVKAKEKVLQVIKDTNRLISKAEIEEVLFSLSRTTIEKALKELVTEEKIELVTKGHYAKYSIK